jgi:hypothetical protein
VSEAHVTGRRRKTSYLRSEESNQKIDPTGSSLPMPLSLAAATLPAAESRGVFYGWLLLKKQKQNTCTLSAAAELSSFFAAPHQQHPLSQQRKLRSLSHDKLPSITSNSNFCILWILDFIHFWVSRHRAASALSACESERSERATRERAREADFLLLLLIFFFCAARCALLRDSRPDPQMDSRYI